MVAIGMINILLSRQRLITAKIDQTKALHIAEAGVNYYRWHLAHDPQDYQDGTEDDGPYIHEYYDPQGSLIGYFSLDITPPEIGSSVVTIKSTGWTSRSPNIKRTVKVQLGEKSLTQYAVVTDSDIRFGSDTDVYGEIHSNGGIRFDGIAHNVVSSHQEQYTDPDYAGLCDIDPHNPNICPGVWTSQPDESEVFLAGKEIGSEEINFDLFTTDLNDIKNAALNNAVKINNYLWTGDGIYLKSSSAAGYRIVLESDDIDVFRVTRTAGSCYGNDMRYITQESTVATNISFPSNGYIFVEDDIWVEGEIDDKAITIVAAKLPEPGNTNTCNGCKSIFINNDIVYADRDETEILGLIAQKDILVGLVSQNDLEIDAALIAQYGTVSRDYFPSYCSQTYYKRDTITVYGSITTNQRYGFSWICGNPGYWCSGYKYRNLIYDSNLLYGPPPGFPTTGEADFLSWEEVAE